MTTHEVQPPSTNMSKTPDRWGLLASVMGPAVVCVAMLFRALNPQPYGYYQLLRWVTCGSCIWLMIQSHAFRRPPLMVGFAIVGVVFNPLFPFYLSRQTWNMLNIGAAVALAALASALCWRQVNTKGHRWLIALIVASTVGYAAWRALHLPGSTASRTGLRAPRPRAPRR